MLAERASTAENCSQASSSGWIGTPGIFDRAREGQEVVGGADIGGVLLSRRRTAGCRGPGGTSIGRAPSGLKKKSPRAVSGPRANISMLVSSLSEPDRQAENQNYIRKKSFQLFRKYRMDFYRSELTKRTKQEHNQPVQSRWESECAFVSASRRHATGPSRAGPVRVAVMRRGRGKG